MQLLTGRVLVVLAVLILTVSVGGQETGYPIVLSKPFDQNILLNVSSEADGQQIADNFQLTAGETIGEITWFGGYASSDNATVNRSFKLRIFDDSGGVPATIPFYENIVSVAGVDTGTDNKSGKDIFQYTTVIDPVALNAETDYWFSVLENDLTTATGIWFWQASNPVQGEKIGFRSNDGVAWSPFFDLTRNEMAFSLSATDSIPDPSTNLDHFLSYKVKRTKGTPKFEKLEVTLTDQFESGVLFEVKKPKELYNPADKNSEGIINLDTHLVGYDIKLAKTDPPQPKHVERTNIEVVNQFGAIFVDTKKPDRLLVPSLKDLDTPIPDIDVPAVFTIDHFKCYKVKVSEGSEFPEGIQVDVVDQFNQPKLFDVEKPKRLCNPVDKNGEGIDNPDTHLMCYKVKRAEDEPKHEKVKGIHINNQFGPLQIDTKKEAELCVPSTKTLP